MPTHMQEFGEELNIDLGLFQIDPVKFARGYGKAFGNCMFCRKALSDPQSVAVGYGPTCAATYGLPHGDMSPEEAKKQSSFEFKLPSGKTQPTQPTATADSISIEHLQEVAIIQLSDAKHEQISELIRIQPEDEYMFLVTALWENL